MPARTRSLTFVVRGDIVSTTGYARAARARLGRKDETGADLWQEGSLTRLRRSGSNVFLAIQSLAPRKGRPVPINEWHRHVRVTPSSTSVLLAKLNFRHAHGIGPDPRRHVVDLLRRYGIPDGDPIRIGLISGVPSNDEMLWLTAGASALVTCSYGEGFGGPVVEAINPGTPVIASRHTDIADLPPADDPLQYGARSLCVQLRHLVDVYPPSSRRSGPGVPAAFDALHPRQRTQAVNGARAHAQAFCAVPVVRRLVPDAVETLVWRRKAA